MIVPSESTLRLAMLAHVAALSAAALCVNASGAPIQVGTLVIEDTVPDGATYDPGFGTLHNQTALITQLVPGAPVDVVSSFSGTSGAVDGVTDGGDIGLNTDPNSFSISRLGRFGGTTNAGGVQWGIDLSPLETYLTSNSLPLSALYIGLDVDFSDLNSEMDVYLSYTDASQSIALTNFALNSTDAATNWTNPAQGNLGSIVNGTHEVIALNVSGAPYQNTIDLLPLYDAGVRDVNLVFAHQEFWGNGDVAAIQFDSGVYIDTTLVPEPASVGMLVLGGLSVVLRKRLA